MTISQGMIDAANSALKEYNLNSHKDSRLATAFDDLCDVCREMFEFCGVDIKPHYSDNMYLIYDGRLYETLGDEFLFMGFD